LSLVRFDVAFRTKVRNVICAFRLFLTIVKDPGLTQDSRWEEIPYEFKSLADLQVIAERVRQLRKKEKVRLRNRP